MADLAKTKTKKIKHNKVNNDMWKMFDEEIHNKFITMKN